MPMGTAFIQLDRVFANSDPSGNVTEAPHSSLDEAPQGRTQAGKLSAQHPHRAALRSLSPPATLGRTRPHFRF